MTFSIPWARVRLPRRQTRLIGIIITILWLAIGATGQTATSARTLMPDDLFRLRRVGVTAWAPNGLFATIEFSKDRRWFDSVPENDISLLDVKTRSLRVLSPKSPVYLGFFNAVWSPDSRRVAFLSLDRAASVRVWVWTVGTQTPSRMANVDARIGLNDPPIAWIDSDRLAIMAWERDAVRSGPLYTRVLKGRNGATNWKRAIEGKTPSVSVVESRSTPTPTSPEPAVELLSVDLRSGLRKSLARGHLHRLVVTPGGCCISFVRPNPKESVASYLDTATSDVEAGYDAVNWGTERQLIDARSGAQLSQPTENVPAKPQPKRAAATPPRSDARLLSRAPTGDAALFVANGPDGSRLWLSGGAGRALTESLEIWRANEWMSEINLGRAEPLSYTAQDGTPLTGWLLLPVNHVPGTRVPVVTVVYPSTMHSKNVPFGFSPYDAHFEHPQLFSAMGYAVLLPSMPEPKDPAQSHALPSLLNGVIPAIDAAIANGVADSDRVAVLGQSDGGFAALGLITQTNRFRTAMASASFSNFTSLYGTFYGPYRHGDSGRPEVGQALRVLNLEKGRMGMGEPPWKELDRYRENSAINYVHKVETPLLLIHGELDFIPIQQAEEFFTALYRQDKRVQLVRYAGEGHTIADRANVLDLWRRIDSWLKETMAPRNTTP